MNVTSKTPRVVPWSTWDEWQGIYHCLYSREDHFKKKGLSRVSPLLPHSPRFLTFQIQLCAWKCRGDVPASVESTGAFVEIMLNDKPSPLNPVRSESELRLSYSMAIIRMINGLTSVFQKGVYAMSIATICDRIGLPADMVEYRHKASHNQLPSLSELRKCAADALNWLKINYWEAQARRCDVEDDLKAKFKEYKSIQKTMLFDSKSGSQMTLYKKRKAVLHAIVEISHNRLNNLLIPYIVERILIPRNKKISRTKYKELPRRLKKIWFDMVKYFVKVWHNFLPYLLLYIADRILAIASSESFESSVDDNVTYEVSILKCWYYLLLETYFICPTSKDEDEESDDEIFILPSKEIMYLCFNRMCKTSVKIIKKTMLAMKDNEEREQLVPKVKELFHYKSRAMMLTNDEKVVGNTKKRGFEEIAPGEFDLDHFEALLGQMQNNEANETWEECTEELPPGIGLKKDGSSPDHLELPSELDNFENANFYLSKQDCELYGYEFQIV